jgi:hypothetical protein
MIPSCLDDFLFNPAATSPFITVVPGLAYKLKEMPKPENDEIVSNLKIIAPLWLSLESNDK